MAEFTASARRPNTSLPSSSSATSRKEPPRPSPGSERASSMTPAAFPSRLLISSPGNTKGGKYHCTVDFLFDWFGISCVITDNFCFYLQNRLIQTGQTGGQWYSDTSTFSIPCRHVHVVVFRARKYVAPSR